MTLAEYLAEMRERVEVKAHYFDPPNFWRDQYAYDVSKLHAIIEEQAKALEKIMNVSGTSTLHYHTACDAQTRINALIAKGEK